VIEKTHRNTSICSFFENFEAKSTKFHPKLAKPSPYVKSIERSSEPKYDINTTQNISTRKSKKLYELREKMSKHRPKYVQLLQGSNDISLLIHLQSKYQIYYNRGLYGAWPSFMPMPNVGTTLSFCSNNYMIAKSKIDVANLGLFILSHISVPPKQSIALMPYCGPLYSQFDYLNIVKYKHNISMYSMCMNGYAYGKFSRKHLLYIDGHPRNHGNYCNLGMHPYLSSLFSLCLHQFFLFWLVKLVSHY
jgi:hypothetical protein